MKQTRSTIDQDFHGALRNLATTLRPNTVKNYRYILNHFRRYLKTSFPEIQACCQLLRHPHIVGWLRALHQHQPPLANSTRIALILMVRRVLNDLTLEGKCVAAQQPLFVRGDIPTQDLYLPKPLSPEGDLRLQQKLQQVDDLPANGLLLLRTTGIRIGECLSLGTNALRHLGGPDWALHVPIGKLHNERWVPVDSHGRDIFARILQLRSDQEPFGLLLLKKNGRRVSYDAMSRSLRRAAEDAGCSERVTPHRLRHTYATSLLRAGVSILAIKEMLGHRSLAMTMRYIQVTQMDLQQEYHRARLQMAALYSRPTLKAPESGIAAIRHAIDQARHLIEMYRRGLDPISRLSIHRLDRRLAKIAAKLLMLSRAPE